MTSKSISERAYYPNAKYNVCCGPSNTNIKNKHLKFSKLKDADAMNSVNVDALEKCIYFISIWVRTHTHTDVFFHSFSIYLSSLIHWNVDFIYDIMLRLLV